MRRTLFVLTLIAMLGGFAAAQDGRVLPSLTARENTQIVSAQPDTKSTARRKSGNLPFCPPTKCLYYAGDFDSTDSNADGLFNATLTDDKIVGQVWVGVKPTKAATVAGVTFNELFGESGVGSNPTPFQTRIGITEGHAGKIVCNTNGTATEAVYGESDFGLVQYSYTVKKLKKACKIAKGTTKYPSTYVNLLPTFGDSYPDTEYLVNVEDAQPKNHTGWPNDQNDCYFNGAAFHDNYVTCNSQSQHGGDGFSEFSIALTGTETK